MMQNGWIITVLVLLPNLLVVIFPPNDSPPELKRQKPFYMVIAGVLERVGQVGCFITPFFFTLYFDTSMDKILLWVAFFALLFYYAGWVRYIIQGREFRLLFAPLANVQLPMAIAPILVFLLTGINMQSWLLVIAAFVLAVGHLPVSWFERKRCQLA